ncbi:MAG: hypothetical protein WBK55_09950 [Alphaproteobacteria bacterium]
MPERLLLGRAEILAALFQILTEFNVFLDISNPAPVNIAINAAGVGLGTAILRYAAGLDLYFGHDRASDETRGKQRKNGNESVSEHREPVV